MKTTTSTFKRSRVASAWLCLMAAAALSGQSTAHAAIIDNGCAAAGTPISQAGTVLNDGLDTKTGIVFDSVASSLKISTSGGSFVGGQASVSDPIEISCAADFDGDGWMDFVGGTGNSAAASSASKIKFYKNRTFDNPAPAKWANQSIDCSLASNAAQCFRTPKFVATKLAAVSPSTTSYHVEEGSVKNVGGSMACGDFNKDGYPDFIYLRCVGTTETCGNSTGRNVRGDMFLGMAPSGGLPRFQTKYPIDTQSNLNSLLPLGSGPTTRIAVVDWNRDGWNDMVVGTWNSSGNNGSLKLLINDKNATTPRFTTTTLVADTGMGTDGTNSVTVADYTGDGKWDVIVGGQQAANMRLYTGLESANTTYTTLTFPTAAVAPATVGPGTAAALGHVAILATADFNADGKPDIASGSHNVSNGGGFAYVWVNNGTPTPFSGGPTKGLTRRDTSTTPQTTDYDGGFVMDYDHDPGLLPDPIFMDDDSANYKVLANIFETKYAACGEIISKPLDVGTVATTESVISDARLKPTMSVPSGTRVDWFASNDNAANWTAAPLCAGSTTDYCATFTNTVGNQLRWRALMYSNSAGSCSAAAGLNTPSVSAVQAGFNYVTAKNHYRAGVVEAAGIIYVGAMRQPGSAGQFYALDNATGAVLWNATDKLEVMADGARNIYTSTANNVRLSFDVATVSGTNTNSTLLRNAMAVADAAAGTLVVNWVRSARFGLLDFKRFGAVENSTSAILSPPRPPVYVYASGTTATERALINNFVSTNATRPQLAFVGSKDGMVHAFRTNPNDLADTTNGVEAWAYVPYDVLSQYGADCTQSSTASPKVCAATNKSDGVRTYPDGAPTLVDVKIGGVYKTVLIMGEGNGGNGIFALDVTNTINSSGTVVGPTPLWRFTDANMGRTYSKPAVIRVKDATGDRFLAVFASGNATTDLGDSVYAIDVATGALVWRFDIGDSNAYVATDITAFETDDTAEPAPTPALDGYIDRVVFADNKGRVWKLNPAATPVGGVIPAMGSVNVGLGATKLALFSTHYTGGALNAERAIAGAIGAAPDASGRVALFFGTGGTDDTPDTAQNEFYAVYADNGQLRNKFTPAVGVKFYGGVTVNDGQIIFSNGKMVSGAGLCATTQGTIDVRDLNTFALLSTLPTTSKIMAPMFARDGQIYTVTLAGEIKVAGDPSDGSAGGGSGSGGNGNGTGQGVVDGPMTIMSWQQVQ